MNGTQVANSITVGFQSLFITGTSSIGNSSHALILKVNLAGEIIWQREMGAQTQGTGLICTADDKLLMVGTSADLNGDQNVMLVKLDQEGNSIWERSFGGAMADQGKDVIELENGDFMVIGTTQSFGAGVASMYVIRTDAEGNEVWSRTFGGEGLDGGSELVQIDAFEVMLLGFTGSFGAGDRDIYMQSVSLNGDSLWSSTYGGAAYEESQAFAITDNGGFVMSNHSASEEPNHSLMATKLDANGSVIWEHHFGTSTEHEGGEGVLVDYDGDYIFLGRTNSFGNDEQVYFIKTDADGNVLEELNFGAEGDQRGLDIIQGANSYAIVGTSTINGDTDILLISHPK